MIIDKLEQVEDTKGNNGERGHWGRVLVALLHLLGIDTVLSMVLAAVSTCLRVCLAVKVALLVVSCACVCLQACVTFLICCMKDD